MHKRIFDFWNCRSKDHAYAEYKFNRLIKKYINESNEEVHRNSLYLRNVVDMVHKLYQW